MLCFLLLAASVAPIDIVRSAVELSQKTDNLRQRYAFTQETVQRSSGKTTSKTYEVTFDKGRQFRRLTQRDGQTVSEKAELYERGEKHRQELLGELTKAFDYSFGPDQAIDGLDCWQLVAKPRPGYKAPSVKLSFLTQMEGNVWISKKYNRLVRLDAITTGPVSFGWFLFKMAPGTRIYMEQARIDDDVWMPKRLKMVYDARLMFKTVKGEMETTSSNFRRVNPST